MKTPLRPIVYLMLAIGIGLPGCDTFESEDEQPPIVLDPKTYDDNAVFTAPADPGQAPTEAATEEASEERVTIDAMVGQINGKPVFASEIFRVIGEEALTRIGQEKTRSQFIREVSTAVRDVLELRVTNTLIVAEAESQLTDNQRAGMKAILQKEREKLFARFLGSQQRAEEWLLSEGYGDLDTYIEEQRQQMLVGQYRQTNIFPKVHITRQQIERHYRDNITEYVKPGQITLRLIKVNSATVADQVQAALDSGQPFPAVAQQYTTFSPSTGGQRQFTDNIETFDSLSDEFDAAVQKLAVGQHSPRLDMDNQHWWVYLEAFEAGESQSLQDVYLDIESSLRIYKAQRLMQQHIVDMRKQGNYTPVNDMVVALTNIAANRFSQNN